MGVERPYYNRYQTGGLQHLLARQIRSEIGDEDFDEFFTFSFVRNPWDRAVSQFLYMKSQRPLRRFYGMNRFTSFRSYLEALQGGLQDHHVQSFAQTDFVTDEDGECIVDFVGRFERLEQDFAAIADRLGVQIELPHSRRSKGRKPLDYYYDDRTRQMVADLYSGDIERFGYEYRGAR